MINVFIAVFKLGLRIEGPSQAKLDPKKNPNGIMDVTYYPTEPGEYAVHVLCNNDDIPKSPFMADIKPADGQQPITPSVAPTAAAAPVGAAPAGPASKTPFDASKVHI